MYRPVVATVDLVAIRNNVAYLKSRMSEGCRLMAVVKANGYGHGDIQTAGAALEGGADRLGVALLEEAVRLREGGFACPIHLLFEPPVEAAAASVEAGIICNVYTRRFARSLSESAMERGREAVVHVKVDTGMRRVGIYPGDVAGFIEHLGDLPSVRVEGICTHFAVATEPQDRFTMEQLRQFEQSATAAENALGYELVKHAANSAGLLAFPESQYDMVRAGIAIYGLPPSSRFERGWPLSPALSLRGELGQVKRVGAGEGISYGLEYAPERDTYIAVAPLGYADGFTRLLSGKAEVLVEGKRRPVVGVICMDTCMVELGEEPVEPGTPFVVLGSDGEEEITAEDIAAKLGTINYEVTCMISSRVPRLYVREQSREGES